MLWPPMISPDRLDERGPAQDPTIWLCGSGSVAGAPVSVLAIRIDPARRLTPDYRKDVDQSLYDALELDAKIDDIASLAGADRLATVEIEQGTYLVCVVPAAVS